MNLDRRYLVWALSYAAAGLALGIYMAASNNHGQLVTHAHVLLIGFVLSLIYGIIHKLWLEKPNKGVANAQFVVHQAATAIVSVGLFVLFAGLVPEPTLGPILGVASVGVLLGMLLMLYMVLKSGTSKVAIET